MIQGFLLSTPVRRFYPISKDVSPAKKKTIDSILALADKHSVKISRAFLESISKVQEVVTLKDLEWALKNGYVDTVNKLVADAVAKTGFAAVAAASTNALVDGGKLAAQKLSGQLPSSIDVYFDAVNPKVAGWQKTNTANLVREITAETKEVIRNVIIQGVADGRNPRDTARDIKQSIGLTVRQEKAVANYRKMLETGNQEALTRALRDKRYDAATKRAAESPLPKAQIDKMVERYRERYLKYRAVTIGRTESIRAIQAGQQQLWQQAVDDGKFAEDEVRRSWIYTHDGKVREAHRDIPRLNPRGVGLNEPFKSSYGPIFFPGDPQAPAANTINCRCTVFVRYVPSLKEPEPIVPEPQPIAPQPTEVVTPEPPKVVKPPNPQAPTKYDDLKAWQAEWDDFFRSIGKPVLPSFEDYSTSLYAQLGAWQQDVEKWYASQTVKNPQPFSYLAYLKYRSDSPTFQKALEKAYKESDYDNWMKLKAAKPKKPKAAKPAASAGVEPVTPSFNAPRLDSKALADEAASIFGLGSTKKYGLPISGKQAAVLRHYTGSFYSEVNPAIYRSVKEGKPLEEKYEKFRVALNAAIADLDRYTAGAVYRGYNPRSISKDDSAEEYRKVMQTGGTVHWPAITSTTRSVQVAENFGGDTGIFVEIRKSRSGANVKQLSKYAHEEEILFPTDTRFRVISVERQDRGRAWHGGQDYRYYVVLEEDDTPVAKVSRFKAEEIEKAVEWTDEDTRRFIDKMQSAGGDDGSPIFVLGLRR